MHGGVSLLVAVAHSVSTTPIFTWRAVSCAAVLAFSGLLPGAVYAGAAVTGDVTPVVNWGDANDLVVGDTASGSLQIEPPGAAVRSASGWLGLTAGGVGTAKISGLGAYWIMNGSLIIGASGNGTLTLANHGSTTVGANGQGFVELARNSGAVGVINIGTAPGSVAADAAGVLDAAEVRFGAGMGTLNFNSVSTVLFSSALVSSAAGSHKLNHYAGITQLLGDSTRFNGNTTVSGGELQILNVLGTEVGRIDAGATAGATARVKVSNSGSTWALSGNLFVGGAGPAELSISNSGTVSNQFAMVDARSNGTASVAISDAGSRWVNRETLLVGSEGGRGALSILAGGYVSSVDGVIGRLQNGNGTLLVTGHGSTWANARELRVGDLEGQGTMMIETGGIVSNVDSFVGSMSGSGNVIVRGAGSLWKNSGAMTLGFGVGTGAGSLTIAQGGVVNVGASNAGSVTLAKGAFLFYRSSGTINIGAPVGQAAVGAGTLNAGDILFGNGNATVNFNHSDTAYTFATRLTSDVGNGSHSLNQIAGTTRLTGDSGTFQGKTTVSGGRLVVLDQLGGRAEVTTGGTLQYGDGSVGTANLVAADLKVSGAGSTLALRGPAKLEVSGELNMADHTVLDLTPGSNAAELKAQTLKLGNNVTFNLAGISSLAGNQEFISTKSGIAGDFSTVNIGGYSGAVDYLTLVTKKSADGTKYLATHGMSWGAQNNLAHGTFTLAQATDRFDVSVGLADQASNSTWNGSTLTKEGAGTLVLSGSSTYTGGTQVNAGTLVADHNQALGTGNVTVGASATLAVNSGVALQVQGNLGLQAGSTYRVFVDPDAVTSGSVNVSGTATLTGALLDIQANTDLSTNQTYTILTAGTVIDQFAKVTSNYAYLAPQLDYSNSGQVNMSLKRKLGSGGGSLGFTDLASTPNQVSAANALAGLPSSHPLYQHIETLAAGAPAAVFSSLSGDAHASVGGSLPSLGALAPSITSNHLRNNLTAGMAPGAPVAQSDSALPASAWPSSKALPAWAEVVGHWQRYDGDGNAATLKQRTTGLFLGVDQEVGTSGWRLGGSLGYTNADGKVADRASESDVNSYSAAVYGGKSFGTGVGPRINVLGGLAYTWHDIETTRRVTSLGQTLKADYSAHTAQLFAEVGYAIGQYDQFGFEPFMGVSLGQQRTGSFQERGGFAALSGQSNTDDLASTTLGLRMHSDFQLAGKDARVRTTVGWRHAFGDVTAEKTMAFEGGQNFTVAGAPLARNTAVLGLEADVALSRTAALVLGYKGEMGSGQRDHSANVKLRWAF